MLNIKSLREFKKITQDEICKLTGIKKRTYVDYENGKTDIPLSKLQLIATALNVTINDLIVEKKTNILNEPGPVYEIEEKVVTELKKQNDLLRENYHLSKEMIDLQKEKIEVLQQKLQQCEEQKKSVGNNKPFP